MDLFQILTLISIVGGFVLLYFFLNSQAHSGGTESAELKRMIEERAVLKTELEQKTEELGKLTGELESEKEERNKLEGKGKQLFAEITGYKEENRRLREEIGELKKQVTKFDAEKDRREKEFERSTEQLENARKKLLEEQERVKREDEEKMQQEKEEWDRMWNEHENMVLARLKETCQDKNIGFQFYENTSLPSGFDTKLKPDFLVEFLDKYIIFDAKKSKDLGNYLTDQVKKTAEKIQKSKSKDAIYPILFFVVPSEELAKLKKTFFYEEGISFYIIDTSAIESILAAYKRVTTYKNVSKIDPQNREKIVDLVARYDRHISLQNAANVVLTKEGVGVMKLKDNISDDMQEEVDTKKKNMRPPKLSDADIKSLAQDFEQQEKDIDALVDPKTAISKEDVKEIQRSLL